MNSVQSALDRRASATYALLQIVVVTVFFLHALFISLRYIMPLMLTLLIFAPFGLATLMEKYRDKNGVEGRRRSSHTGKSPSPTPWCAH